jgi:transglutaminase-like putative cysteine protease
MRLRVRHLTEYSYDAPVSYGLQRLRLLPQSGSTQAVVSWALAVEGAKEEARFFDQFGNETRLVSLEGQPSKISVEASGLVETYETAGVTGQHQGFAPLWLFRQSTPLTAPGEGVASIVETVEQSDEIATLHGLMDAIADRIVYQKGETETSTTAEEAVSQGSGVCQDQTHVFLSAARRLGYPARYVSGYLLMDDTIDQTASHAWAEAHVSGLGWVGFDVANRMSPDGRYVRLATGRDYRDVAPVSGITLGQAGETLAVHISVEQ